MSALPDVYWAIISPAADARASPSTASDVENLASMVTGIATEPNLPAEGGATESDGPSSVSARVLRSDVAKLPLAGEDWPATLLPQHTTSPLWRRPQLWSSPAAISAKLPLGGEDCPKAPSPQHVASPSSYSAQV